MKAMILTGQKNLSEKNDPLFLSEISLPEIKKDEVLIKVKACGVCHTDLDIIEGKISLANLPVILGHQVVGEIFETYSDEFKVSDRVGVGWIFFSCGKCIYCSTGRENLCENFSATGRDHNGGYAEFMIAKKDFIYKIPDSISDISAAPLLCAGGVGYRSIRLADIKEGQSIGLTGFGGSAHIVLKLLKSLYKNIKIYVFARSKEQQDFSLELGAVWSGGIDSYSPEKLDSIIDTTPAWKPAVEALKNLKPGARLVINAIRKEEADKNCLLELDYEKHLWQEKEIKSVANVTRKDLEDFLKLAGKFLINPEVKTYKLEEANTALNELKKGKIKGSIVLTD